MRTSLARRTAGVAVVALGAALLPTAPADAAVLNAPARTWGVNGRVTVILPVGGRVILGGTFSSVIDTAGRVTAASNLAAFDPATGRFDTWAGRTNDTVNALAASPDGATVYLGGSFNRVDDSPRVRLAALDAVDGTLVPGWAPVPDLVVDNLAADATGVYAVGLFGAVTDSTGTYPRSYVARLDLATGSVDPSFAPLPNDRVRAVALAPDGSRVYLGGDFTAVSGKARTNKVAAVFAANGSVDTGFAAAANNRTNYAQVFDLATDGVRLVEAVGGSGGACTAIDPRSGALQWTKRSNGNMQSVRIGHGLAYCGGHYGGTTGFDGLPRYKLAAVDLATRTTTSFAPNVNSALGTWSLAVDADRLYLGGDFDKVSGIAQPHFAVFPVTQTAPLAPELTADGNDGVVHLSWVPPSSDGGRAVTGYRLYRRTTGGSFSLRASPGAATRSLDDTRVVNGQAYEYYLSAVNPLGEGAASPPATATPQVLVQSPPGAPTGLTATGGSGLVQLSWTAPADDGNSPVTGYEVWRGTDPASQTLLATTDASTVGYADRAIVAGTSYVYSVRAHNAIGSGPPSADATATPSAGRPGAPQGLTATLAGSVVSLSWSPPAYDGGAAITKYVVIRNNVQLPGARVDPPTTAYDDDLALSGDGSGSYTYQVKAVNAAGGSGYSNAVVVSYP